MRLGIFCRNFDLALERTLERNHLSSINDNETHFHLRACAAREGPKTREKLQITARIVYSIHTISVNVKKILKFFSKSPE